MIKSIIIISNYFNHHQKPLSDALFQCIGPGFLFIETESMDQERINMGWGLKEIPAYVVTKCDLDANKEEYVDLIYEADAVIIGSAPYEFVQKRIVDNKLVFRYSERQLKKGMEVWKYPLRFFRWHRYYSNRKNVHLLCASAYAAEDYAKFGLFRGKSYKWGYFPEKRTYESIESVIAKKRQNSIIWVARFIDWKHPEMAVEVGKRLKMAGYSFELSMIGNGEMLAEIADMVHREALEDVVHIWGGMTPDEVREKMEKAAIHIFTSDQQEGWGAVLNESMNSACVPVANKNIGSAPYLIESGENGFMFSDVDELCSRIRFLLDNEDVRCEMAKKAYKTIQDEWNAEVAARRLCCLIERMRSGEYTFFESGICGDARK